MDAVLEFFQTILTKLEVIIPTLITILGSCGGVIIYKMTNILANVKVLKGFVKDNEEQIKDLTSKLDATLKAVNERDEVIKYLVNSTPNALVKKQANEMCSKLTPIVQNKSLDITNVAKEKPTKKVKVKKSKKVN